MKELRRQHDQRQQQQQQLRAGGGSVGGGGGGGAQARLDRARVAQQHVSECMQNTSCQIMLCEDSQK